MNIIHGKLLEQQLRLGPVRGFVCWVAAALEPVGRGWEGCPGFQPLCQGWQDVQLGPPLPVRVSLRLWQ